jgi:tripartite-type tricarboxylate transporter receptor subunit TctC
MQISNHEDGIAIYLESGNLHIFPQRQKVQSIVNSQVVAPNQILRRHLMTKRFSPYLPRCENFEMKPKWANRKRSGGLPCLPTGCRMGLQFISALRSLWPILRPLLCLAAVCWAASAAAQDAFPSRTLTTIVPFPAGTTPDAAVRTLATALSVSAKVSVVVENRPGAYGIIAAQAAMRAAPDGYTVMLGVNTTHAANVSLYKSVPYSPLRDFAPITLVERAGSVFVVPASSSAASIADLVKLAKDRPGALNVGVANATTQVSAATFGKLAKVSFTLVPYQGAPQLAVDLASGWIDFSVYDVINTIALRNSGKLRALAVTSSTRNPALPDVPSMAELGFPTFSITSWVAYFAPAGTPDIVIAKLNVLIHAAYSTAPVRELAEKTGNRIQLSSPQELRAFVESEIENWRELVASAGIEPK